MIRSLFTSFIIQVLWRLAYSVATERLEVEQREKKKEKIEKDKMQSRLNGLAVRCWMRTKPKKVEEKKIIELCT